MNPLIVPVVAIACTAWTIVTIYKLKYSQRNRNNIANENNNAELKLELDALKKRVETLETIITDKSYDLKQKIDNL